MIVICILALLVCTALLVVRLRGLLASIMIMGIYSFLGASWMLLLDAPDVAFTEAAVGAGISTILALGALALTGDRESRPTRVSPLPLLAVTVTGAILIYGTFDMPRYGDPLAPIHRHVTPEYILENVGNSRFAMERIAIPNTVTVVLASYRGYDTLGETTVVFTAAIAVVLLLRGRRRRDGEGAP